jgi:hypothetical protein
MKKQKLPRTLPPLALGVVPLANCPWCKAHVSPASEDNPCSKYYDCGAIYTLYDTPEGKRWMCRSDCRTPDVIGSKWRLKVDDGFSGILTITRVGDDPFVFYEMNGVEMMAFLPTFLHDCEPVTE